MCITQFQKPLKKFYFLKDSVLVSKFNSKVCVTPVHWEPWDIQNPSIFLTQYIWNSGIYGTLIYSEPQYIQNPVIFRTLAYSEPWYIHHLGIFRTLVYSELSYIHNPGIFRTRAISGPQVHSQPCPTSAIERFTKKLKFFFVLFSNMANSDLSETGHNKVKLVLNILGYSETWGGIFMNYPGIFRHIKKPV